MICCVKFKLVLQIPGTSLFALLQDIWNDSLALILPVSQPGLAMWPAGQKRSPGQLCLTAAEIPKACLGRGTTSWVPKTGLRGLHLKIPLVQRCLCSLSPLLLCPCVFIKSCVTLCALTGPCLFPSGINDTLQLYLKEIFVFTTNKSIDAFLVSDLANINNNLTLNAYYLSDTVLDTSININSLLFKITLHAGLKKKWFILSSFHKRKLKWWNPRNWFFPGHFY